MESSGKRPVIRGSSLGAWALSERAARNAITTMAARASLGMVKGYNTLT